MKNVLVVSITLIFLSSCKKSHSDDALGSQPIWGQLEVYATNNYDNQGHYGSGESAQFYSLNTPIKYGIVVVTAVLLNGTPVPIPPYTSNLNYFSNIDSIPVNPQPNNMTWTVTGSDVIPSFTYTASKPFPGYAGTLPGTITKAAGITLAVPQGALHNSDQAFLCISQAGLGASLIKEITNGSTSFTSQELATLVAGQPATLYVSVENREYATIGGKDFLFDKVYDYQQVVTVQ